MVFSRQLVISIGVSALSATLLFLYFRNRMTNVERKVDVMFDLIQSHETDRQQQLSQSYMANRNEEQVPSSQYTENLNSQNSQERNLIDVSDDDDDDDSEYDSEDSREVSDNEDDLAERIKLVTTDIDLQEAEEEKNVVVLETTNNDPISIDESVQLEEVTNNLEEDNDTTDNKEIVQKVEEEAEEDEEAEDSLVEDSLEEDSESDTEQETLEEKTHIQYSKLRVSELKALAEAKGLLNYKSLKKQPLIDLIIASE